MKSFTMLIKRPFRSGEEKNLLPHLDDHLFVNGKPCNVDDNDLIISPCILNRQSFRHNEKKTF